MNGRLLRTLQRALVLENRKWPAHLVEIPPAQWPDDLHVTLTGSAPEQVWRSNRFTAVLYREHSKAARRLSIMRSMIGADGKALQGITWDELQEIKGQCGFGDADAVELFPADADLVNVSNMRHLWILPEPSPLVWRSRDVRRPA